MSEIHPFEAAGLGKAPFRYLGCSEAEYGPIIISERGGVTTSVGAPGQLMSVCKCCYQPISEVHRIKSADGLVSSVGRTCIKKLAPKGDPVLRKANRASRARQVAREEGRIDALRQRLVASDLRERLAAMPSPTRPQEETAAAWVDWMLRHAGHSGRMRVVRWVDKRIPA